MKMNVPTVGMRIIKTAVAVMLSNLVLLPMNLLFPPSSGEMRWGSFYACVAAVNCMLPDHGKAKKTV